MTPRPRIALVSREVSPFSGGGIGAFVAATAGLLSAVAEVTVFTSAAHERRWRKLRDQHPVAPAAKFVFVPEVHGFELGGFRGRGHLWSARVMAALREHYGSSGPELVEFQDFLGEGFVTAQARRAAAGWLSETAVCVRVNTTAEICDVLNGHLRSDLDSRVTFELERGGLELCDHVLWAGGDIRATYERFYGEASLANPLRVRQPFAAGTDPVRETRAGGREEPLRVLFLGRLERRKGILELIGALSGLARDDWRLTIAGGDTETGPLGRSVRELAELAIGEDRRFELRGPVERAQVAGLIDAHDLLVVPSRWECWPNVGLEALERNRPLLATPTGGLVEMAVPGESGWLSDDASAEALARELDSLLGSREQLDELVASGGPRAVFERLTDPEPIRTAYLELCGSAARARPRRAPQADPPLVSIVVPYFRLREFVGEAVASACAQTHPRTEVLVVNDGCFEDQPLLEELARTHDVRLLVQPNSGLGAARNLGISTARGSYVLPLDADNVAEPEFAARCVELLEAEPALAYVTCWSRFIDERGQPWRGIEDGERPLGSRSRLLTEANVAGDAAAVFRRSLFERGFRYDPELTSYEDWDLYRALAEAGHHGAVIPEPLIRYRVRSDSMARTLGAPNEARLTRELAARARMRRVAWASGERRSRDEGLERGGATLAAAEARLATSRGSATGAAAVSRLEASAKNPRRLLRPRATQAATERLRLAARRLALRILR